MVPKISICLPTLNARRFLEERIDSIFAQTVNDWELIVCDSYSDDGTWEYLQPFDGDPRVRLYQVPREGLYAGWNECLKRVQGEYVHIATADDTGDKMLLETLLSGFKDSPGAMVSACECVVIDADGREIGKGPTIYDKIIKSRMNGDRFATAGWYEFALMALCGVTWGSFSRLMFKRELFDLAGQFPVTYGISGDWAWALRASVHGGAVHVPGRLATWRVHEGQASATWSLDGYRTYHRIFVDFVQRNEALLRQQWNLDSKAMRRLSDAAWRRYENGTGWFLYQLRKSPIEFVMKGKFIWELDRRLFFRRVLKGCRVRKGTIVTPESAELFLGALGEN
ncbi:glycosyltransferase [Phragmitibacter flavus]|uniref:Glycosyltransferase n=1 Tax=Phragmitibacter flavus TaxID=2576071 RepID=A0A5R8KAD8_9BACT|nr:glycosyltransferase [Phragmitibacter flavus]TLD69261.1 glycosyltransferase [Phragmitibacter flavus]